MRTTAALLLAALVLVACGGDADDVTASNIEAATTTATTQPTTTALPPASRQPATTRMAASTTTASPTTTRTAPAGSGCAVLHGPGEYEGAGMFGDLKLPYWMVVPDAYSDIAPAPLSLHLASGDGGHHSFMDGWRPLLDGLNGLMAMVNTVDAARGEPEALLALVDHLSAEYCVDPQHVHVIGTGTSFGMAERFACSASDRVASFIAAMGTTFPGDCVPERPVPLLSFSGDPDRGGVRALVDRWVEFNGCAPDPIVEDLGSGVHRKTYQGCEADILFYDIDGMPHAWPLHEARGPGATWIAEYDEVDYLVEAFRFFNDQPLPAGPS